MLRVRDVATGEISPDGIPRTRACSLAWTPDGKGFYYTRYPNRGNVPAGEEKYHRSVFRHRLGDDPDARREDLRRRARPQGLARRRAVARTAAGWRSASTRGGPRARSTCSTCTRDRQTRVRARDQRRGDRRQLRRRRGARRSPLPAQPPGRAARPDLRRRSAPPGTRALARDHRPGRRDARERAVSRSRSPAIVSCKDARRAAAPVRPNGNRARAAAAGAGRLSGSLGAREVARALLAFTSFLTPTMVSRGAARRAAEERRSGARSPRRRRGGVRCRAGEVHLARRDPAARCFSCTAAGALRATGAHLRSSLATAASTSTSCRPGGPVGDPVPRERRRLRGGGVARRRRVRREPGTAPACWATSRTCSTTSSPPRAGSSSTGDHARAAGDLGRLQRRPARSGPRSPSGPISSARWSAASACWTCSATISFGSRSSGFPSTVRPTIPPQSAGSCAYSPYHNVARRRGVPGRLLAHGGLRHARRSDARPQDGGPTAGGDGERRPGSAVPREQGGTRRRQAAGQGDRSS